MIRIIRSDDADQRGLGHVAVQLQNDTDIQNAVCPGGGEGHADQGDNEAASDDKIIPRRRAALTGSARSEYRD